jgi:hypothetical protein
MTAKKPDLTKKQCAYLQSHLTKKQVLKLMEILEIRKDRYNASMSVQKLCEGMARERPDLMRGRGWNYLGALLEMIAGATGLAGAYYLSTGVLGPRGQVSGVIMGQGGSYQ